MKTFLKVIFALFLGFSTAQVIADPIQDNTYNGYKAGWFPSSGTPCPVVCRKAHGGKAEFEKFFSVTLKNKYTYVCKSKSVTGAGKGWLYGNNFSSSARNKLCMVSTPNGQVHRKNRFMCLCVH